MMYICLSIILSDKTNGLAKQFNDFDELGVLALLYAFNALVDRLYLLSQLNSPRSLASLPQDVYYQSSKFTIPVSGLDSDYQPIVVVYYPKDENHDRGYFAQQGGTYKAKRRSTKRVKRRVRKTKTLKRRRARKSRRI